MTYFKNVETGRFYRFKNSRVLFHIAGLWRISDTYRPADLTGYPFIAVNMGPSL